MFEGAWAALIKSINPRLTAFYHSKVLASLILAFNVVFVVLMARYIGNDCTKTCAATPLSRTHGKRCDNVDFVKSTFDPPITRDFSDRVSSEVPTGDEFKVYGVFGSHASEIGIDCDIIGGHKPTTHRNCNGKQAHMDKDACKQLFDDEYVCEGCSCLLESEEAQVKPGSLRHIDIVGDVYGLHNTSGEISVALELADGSLHTINKPLCSDDNGKYDDVFVTGDDDFSGTWNYTYNTFVSDQPPTADFCRDYAGMTKTPREWDGEMDFFLDTNYAYERQKNGFVYKISINTTSFQPTCSVNTLLTNQQSRTNEAHYVQNALLNPFNTDRDATVTNFYPHANVATCSPEQPYPDIEYNSRASGPLCADASIYGSCCKYKLVDGVADPTQSSCIQTRTFPSDSALRTWDVLEAMRYPLEGSPAWAKHKASFMNQMIYCCEDICPPTTAAIGAALGYLAFAEIVITLFVLAVYMCVTGNIPTTTQDIKELVNIAMEAEKKEPDNEPTTEVPADQLEAELGSVAVAVRSESE